MRLRRARRTLDDVTGLSALLRRPWPPPLAITVLLAGIGGASLLRSFHDGTPRLLPGPAGSLLGWTVFAMAAGAAAAWVTGADRLEPPERRGARLTLGKLLPFLLLLFLEKWITEELLDGAYGWIGRRFHDPRAADAAYRLWTGLALAGVGLAGALLLRPIRPRLARLLEPIRLGSALALLGGSLAALIALPAAVGALEGGLHWTRPAAAGALLWLVASSQLVRGIAEELYYRGLIQTALARLLAESGLGEGRPARTIAIGAVSVGFAVEHIDPSADLRGAVPSLLFVLVFGALLGVLLETSRNLYLVMLVHTVVNWAVAGILPAPADQAGGPLLPPVPFVLLLVTFVFGGVVASHRRRGFA
ncbi:MAG: CPBP family intramembrane metalloprotease [Acidobacteria bacterium]|nr:MAG: CPBP family intramembrane metalloprotease [Acidobacteriota bacterium]